MGLIWKLLPMCITHCANRSLVKSADQLHAPVRFFSVNPMLRERQTNAELYVVFVKRAGDQCAAFLASSRYRSFMQLFDLVYRWSASVAQLGKLILKLSPLLAGDL